VATSTWTNDYLNAGSHLYSTYLANSVDTYQELADRITYGLGYPTINLELHGNQIFTHIAQAIEMFSKFAGYTLEHLVVDSSKYTLGKGLDLRELFLITSELSGTYAKDVFSSSGETTLIPTTSSTAVTGNGFHPVYIFDCSTIPTYPSEYTFVVTLDADRVHVVKSLVTCTSADGGTATVDITQYGDVYTTASSIVSAVSSTVATSTNIVKIGVTLTGNEYTTASVAGTRTSMENDSTTVSALTGRGCNVGYFDGLTRQGRKVIDVFSYDESTSSSLNTLFTIEQTLAQQTYFSYAMGNYGFDLISWYILKQWLETREKMLSTKRYFRFDDAKQRLLMIPEPKSGEQFWGVLSCYVEKPIKDLIKEPWVYQYATALTKITLGRVRGKFGNAQLFGGTALDTSILQEGLTEKEKLEERLLSGATAGFGDSDPPMFFVG
jgi:hypothetical protein